MKNMNMNLLIASVVSSLALAGCGETNTKTNPLEDYKDLQTVPKHDQVAREQKVPDSAIFSIMVEKNLNFVEGETASYVIKPRCQIPGAAFRLKAKDLPEGAVLKPVDGAKPMGDYQLSWSPKVGTLADQVRADDFDAEIEVEVLEGPDRVANERMAQYGVGKAIQLHLVTSNQQPMIEKCELASGVACTQGQLEVTEGDSVAFTVTVKDLGSPQGSSPRLYLDDDMSESNEIARVAARRYATYIKTPESLGGGLFRFKGKINTKGMEFPAGKTSVVARVVAHVKSRHTGLESAEEVIDVKVAKKIEVAPTPAPTPKPTATPKPAANASNGNAKPAATATPKPAANLNATPTPKPANANAKPSPTATPAASGNGNAKPAPAAAVGGNQ